MSWKLSKYKMNCRRKTSQLCEQLASVSEFTYYWCSVLTDRNYGNHQNKVNITKWNCVKRIALI